MADILDLDEKIEAYSLMTIQTRKCRVCYGDDDENDNTNTLINPCNCKGSIEWIHIGCLRQWLESRLTKISL
jgi:E3 ubiquitin-protein ligase DOA10